ncbi:hypothetical protein KM043_016605 [Ampulex compressa]|nr:hypothetical protein KM043_016605 [Ampulex compressa]
MELHGFSDASERAYALVVYLRIVEGENIGVALVAVKTKLGLSKTCTIASERMNLEAQPPRMTAHLVTADALLRGLLERSSSWWALCRVARLLYTWRDVDRDALLPERTHLSLDQLGRAKVFWLRAA